MGKYTKEEAAVRREYSKLSAKFRRQYNRLKASEQNAVIIGRIELEEVVGLRDREKSNYPSDITTLTNLNNYMTDILDNKLLSTVANKRGKRQAAHTMQDMGYDFVTEDNVKEVFAFLDEVAELNLASAFNSEFLINAWNTAKEKGLTKDQLKRNVERWYDNVRKGKNVNKTYIKYKM